MSRRNPFPLLGLGALLCLQAATAAWAGKGPEAGPNVQVNAPQQAFPNDLPSRSTTTLAASEDGQNLLAGWDDFQGFCGAPVNRPCTPQNPPGLSGFAFSTDGGTTWTDGGSPYPIGVSYTAGHPWVDRGGEEGDELFYFTSRMRATAAGTNSTGIGIHRGRFGAGTFAWEDAQIINSSHPGDFYSRESIAAAKDGSGAAYIVLSNIDALCGVTAGGYGQIEVWRTHDRGATWQGPVVVSPDTGSPNDPADPLCGATGTQQVAPVVSIGPDGEVYLVWQYGPFFNLSGNSNTSYLAFSRSLDGGVTFSAPQLLTQINNMRDNPPVGYAKNRMNDQPRITAATTGSHRGRIYMTFYQAVTPVSGLAAAQSAVSSQIYVMTSDDQGQTWSAPNAIAPPVPPTGIKRFWPTAAVRPGGDLDVIYMESRETQVTPNPTDIECDVQFAGAATNRRKGPLSSLVDTYWVQSRDGGATFSAPVRVSEVTSNWCHVQSTFISGLYSNLGDYLGIATGGNRTFLVWPDGRNGVSDVFFATVEGKTDK
jgi:hypothetical protein